MSNESIKKSNDIQNRSRPLFAVIVDTLRIKKWQAEALRNISRNADFLILNCTNTVSRHDTVRNFCYYILNAIALRSPETKRCALPDSLAILDTASFKAEFDDNWQRLPNNIIDRLHDLRPEAIVKFGMGLVRLPARLPCPILSYHHGNPQKYRGRPAGFYELLSGEGCVGQVVQVLSNRLDAGKIVAFAETKIHPHSYRKTMREAYRISPLLLAEAIHNALTSTFTPIETNGRNYRLPSNQLVLRFWARLMCAKIQRWVYGTFFERSWRVAEAFVGERSPAELLTAFPMHDEWREASCPAPYRFLADPFPDPRGGVLVEALRRRDDCGEILRLIPSKSEVACSGPGHFSYPATVSVGGESFILPEISEWSTPILYRLNKDAVIPCGEITIEGAPKLKDPTPFLAADGRIFLFGNADCDGDGVLRLWSAGGFDQTFIEHPSSPIRISPAGSRMAGAIFETGGSLFRMGQDCTREYGHGVLLFEITILSASNYSERCIRKYRFGHLKGPHTLNFSGPNVLFDFYDVRFSWSAGWRRGLKKVRVITSPRERARNAHLGNRWTGR